MQFTCSHIDTCLGSFLTDHHNRDGELLLGVTVNGESTIGAVFHDLFMELNEVALDNGDQGGFNYDEAGKAIRALRDENHPMELDRSYFDSSLDIPDDDEFNMEEQVQAWFLIQWEEE